MSFSRPIQWFTFMQILSGRTIPLMYGLQRGSGPMSQHLLLCHLYEDEPYLPHFQPQRAQQASVDLTLVTALYLLRYPLQYKPSTIKLRYSSMI
jgi:hypothetical protein